MLGCRHTRVPLIIHDFIPHLSYSPVPLLERSCVAMWWILLRACLALVPSRPSLHPLASSILYSTILFLLLVLLIKYPFCESNDLTSLVISGLDNAHTLVSARLLIRRGSEVGELRCGASRVQGLNERVVSQGGPLDGRNGWNIGRVDESDAEGHSHQCSFERLSSGVGIPCRKSAYAVARHQRRMTRQQAGLAVPGLHDAWALGSKAR